MQINKIVIDNFTAGFNASSRTLPVSIYNGETYILNLVIIENRQCRIAFEGKP